MSTLKLDVDEGTDKRIRYLGYLSLLVICALLLIARLAYLYMANPERFPISTVKIIASYQHISRKQIETVLANYADDSFISLPVFKLQQDLSAIDWVGDVEIDRIWPDTLKIVLKEKLPIAIWNQALMTSEGQLFNMNVPMQDKQIVEMNLPKLSGPKDQQIDVLQVYQKLSKLLAPYGLTASALDLRDNQAWDLYLANGIVLRLGKQDLEKRVLRFCKAYSVMFADKSEQIESVDLRYEHGLAVQWKTGR